MDRDVITLRELINRIASGDELAVEQLYDLTLDKCYGLALRIVRDSAIAEDVIAETYIQAWQEAKNFNPERGSPIAWLLTICRSRAIDMLRKNDRAETHPMPETLNIDLPQHDDPSVLVNAMQEDTKVRFALESLSDQQRQVIALAFFRGYSHEEIAKHLEIPLGTVKSHIRRGHQRMRNFLSTPDADGITTALLN